MDAISEDIILDTNDKENASSEKYHKNQVLLIKSQRTHSVLQLS